MKLTCVISALSGRLGTFPWTSNRPNSSLGFTFCRRNKDFSSRKRYLIHRFFPPHRSLLCGARPICQAIFLVERLSARQSTV